jgi:uncharacterized protein DUF3703
MMSPSLKAAFNNEMDIAKEFYHKANYRDCFHHLERAHILGQRHYVPHVVNHYWMLKVGWQKGDVREVVGQICRILGSVGSLIGVVPIGNTGGANVSIIKPMPIPADLAKYFET